MKALYNVGSKLVVGTVQIRLVFSFIDTESSAIQCQRCMTVIPLLDLLLSLSRIVLMHFYLSFTPRFNVNIDLIYYTYLVMNDITSIMATANEFSQCVLMYFFSILFLVPWER